jgi:hypothetical protein
MMNRIVVDFFHLLDSDHQMKMVRHQHPGVGISDGRNVLVVQLQKVVVIISFSE